MLFKIIAVEKTLVSLFAGHLTLGEDQIKMVQDRINTTNEVTITKFDEVNTSIERKVVDFDTKLVKQFHKLDSDLKKEMVVIKTLVKRDATRLKADLGKIL